jgi:hypothetical protein
MTTKKAVQKKETKDSTQNKFKAKKIGANIIVTYNSEKYSRKVSKEESEILMRKMAFYNKKPSETGKKSIIKLLTPETTKRAKQKEETEAKIKGYKKLQKKENKKSKITESVKRDIMEELEEALASNKDNIPKVQSILDKFKEVEIPKKEESPYGRRGEY